MTGIRPHPALSVPSGSPVFRLDLGGGKEAISVRPRQAGKAWGVNPLATSGRDGGRQSPEELATGLKTLGSRRGQPEEASKEKSVAGEKPSSRDHEAPPHQASSGEKESRTGGSLVKDKCVPGGQRRGGIGGHQDTWKCLGQRWVAGDLATSTLSRGRPLGGCHAGPWSSPAPGPLC